MRSALRKVMAALPAPYRGDAERTSRRILVDPARWMRGTETSDDWDLGVLQHAAFTDRRLLLTYRSGDLPRTYAVDPYGLVSKAGAWYLVADWDGEPRLFRADRVQSATLLDEPVRLRAGQDLASVWTALRSRFESLPTGPRVSCRVRSTQLPIFQRLFARHLVSPPVPLDTEWCTAELAFDEVADTRGLLVMGGSVEVLSPAEVRAELTAVTAELGDLYGD